MDKPEQKRGVFLMGDSRMQRNQEPVQCDVCGHWIGAGDWLHTLVRFDRTGKEILRTRKHLDCEGDL